MHIMYVWRKAEFIGWGFIGGGVSFDITSSSSYIYHHQLDVLRTSPSLYMRYFIRHTHRASAYIIFDTYINK